jgi:hypothetical protein
MTKLFAIVPVQRMWWIGYAGKDPLSKTDATIDWFFLNESINSEIYFEAVPQLVLQFVNNILLGKSWSTIGYVSPIFSVLLIIMYAVMINIIDQRKLARQFEDLGIKSIVNDANQIELSVLG